MANQQKEDSKQPIIIKKIKKGGGHHGGAWKVAYADFVTAMMAFFLLLWLLNVTTEEQKNAISNYFDPTHPKVSQAESGAGGVLGGLSMSPKGAMVSTLQTIATPQPTQSTLNSRAGQADKVNKEGEGKVSLEKAKEILRKKEEERFKDAKKTIEEAIKADSELASLAKNLVIDMTPEGLRIQIIDQEGEPMFASGSAQMFDKTHKLIEKVSKAIEKLPNEISIRGHTDSVPYGKDASYTNWELSTDRANASRRVMLESGLKGERLNNVVGKADTEHLLPDKPKDPQNRRISIILLREELTNPDFENRAEELAKDLPADKAGRPQVPVGTFKKTPGNIEFP